MGGETWTESTAGPEPRVVLAAGGLVWRTGPRGRELAVIHRQRHDDWTLPKGKLEDREAPDAAALREVEEEIGSRTRITAYADRMAYEVDGVPKVVFYWHMEPIDGEFTPSEEVAEVTWLLPEEALERLSHAGEKDLVARANRDC